MIKGFVGQKRLFIDSKAPWLAKSQYRKGAE